VARDEEGSRAGDQADGGDVADAVDPSAISELTDLDRALIERLRRDGREGHRSLAAHLKVNEVTVAAHLRRLEESNLMRVVAVTDIRLFGHREMVFAMLNVSGRPARDVAADFAKLPEAIGVTICSGRYDVIGPVLCRDREHISEMFGGQLRSIRGVASVHGALSLDVLKFDSNWATFRDPGTMPEAQPSDTVDETDLEIIRLLQQNARRSNRSIAAELGVSEGTVRGRIKRMLSDRVFRIQAVSNIAAFGFAAHGYIGVKTAPGKQKAVAAKIAKRDDVPELSRVLDDFDLIAVLVAPDHDALISAAMDEIAQYPGVEKVEIFYGCDSIKHTYGWTWIV
jgi:DNA-binding Lrp family transcriptional regulator